MGDDIEHEDLDEGERLETQSISKIMELCRIYIKNLRILPGMVDKCLKIGQDGGG